MTEGRPRVVALLATHNSGERLEETLRSLQAQTYPNLQILVSDDASTDGTSESGAEAALHDPRIRLVRQSRRRGWIGNINALLALANGDCFFFMPHDDVLTASYVEKLVAALVGRPAAVLAYSDLDCYESGHFREVQVYRELEGETDRVRRAIRWLDQPMSGWCIPYRGLFRAEAVRAFRGLRKHLAGEFGADWVWLFRMALLGEWVPCTDVLYRRNRGKHSLSESWRHGRRKWFSVVMACGREVLRTNLPWREKRRLLHAVAHAAVRVVRGGFVW